MPRNRYLLIAYLTLAFVVGWFGQKIEFRMTHYMYTTPDRAQIIILGDSRAELANWPAGLKSNHIANLAQSGSTSGDMLQVALTVKSGPKYAIIQTGVNDLREQGASVDSVVANIQNTCKVLKSRGITPILLNVIPVYSDWIQQQVGYEEINRRITAVNAKLNGVDLSELAPDGRLLRSYTVDGVHLSEAGYGVVYKIVKEKL